MKKKSKYRGLILIFMSLLLTCASILTLSACGKKTTEKKKRTFENLDENPRPKEIYYEKENDYLFYSDDYFKHRATSYNEHLATLSMYMTKYSMNPGDPHSETDYTWYRNQPLRLVGFFKEIGFAHPLFNDDYTSRTGFNTIGIGCACREIEENGNHFTVIACTVRSGGYFNEWENNVFLGDGSKSDMMHEGWYNAANKVIDFIGYYIQELKSNNMLKTDQIKLWMAGYSRGGAVMNLAGGLLDNKLGMDDAQTRYSVYPGVNLKREDILVYTFEAPQGANLESKTVEKPRSELYNNIFNIVNPNDLVTKVAMSRFGFTRFGIDKFITTEFFDPDPFVANRNVTKALANDREPGYNWRADNFTTYGIHWMDFVTDIDTMASFAGDILKWVADVGDLPSVISQDNKKVNYDANITLNIAMDRALDFIGTRDSYCNSFQNFARKLMHYMFNDVPDTDVLSWESLLVMTAIQGLGYSLFPGMEIFADFVLEDITGATSTDVKYALAVAADLFLEYPTETISLIKNISDVFENHSTQLNVYHAQAQDSYYIQRYNENHDDKIYKVPYRANSELVRLECLDINQGEIHQDGNVVVKVNGSDIGESSIEKCNPGFAVGYYHYATYERTEWFVPACYKLAYGFYEHSDKIWHHVYIHRWTYRTNQNANRTGLYIVDDYFNGDAGVFSGDIDADVEPESTKVTDLTDTYWRINVSGVTIPDPLLISKNITFESNEKTFKKFELKMDMSFPLEPKAVFCYDGTNVAVASLGSQCRFEWVDDNYRTIHITGGDAVKDDGFIQWLLQFACRVG